MGRPHGTGGAPVTVFPHGLYESLVTEALANRLGALPEDRRARTDALRTAEVCPA